MEISEKMEKRCRKGHRFFKSSTCPVCPVCEREKGINEAFPLKIGAPARRALENLGVKSIGQLSNYREADISNLHGMGPSALSKLKTALKASGLSFKK